MQTTSMYDIGANHWIVDTVIKNSINSPEFKILDVGCWKGAMGSNVLKHIPAVHIDGIEGYAPGEYAIRNGYQHIYEYNLNDYENLKTIKEEYDIIVLGDVLEHTICPEKTLDILLNTLKSDGILIVSLPNIGFISYRLMLLLGRWTYSPDGKGGIMDNTHLRFFTLHSMRYFFEKMDLEIIESTGISIVQSKFFFLRYLARIWPSMFALQIEFILKPR